MKENHSISNQALSNYNPIYISREIQTITNEWGKIVAKSQLINDYYKCKCSDDLKGKILENESIVRNMVRKLNEVNKIVYTLKNTEGK